MKILEHLISTLDYDAPVVDIRQGVFHTAVVTHHGGLAATLPRDALQQSPPLVREPGGLLQQTPKQLVEMARSDHILEAAIGIATLNSLLKVDKAACSEVNAAERIMEHGRGRNVAVVGHFPFLPKIREAADHVWVLEKNPREGDRHADQAPEFIPRADVVAITGTALTNHTLDGLLALCRPEAYVILLGDSAPLSPILFEYGVDAVAGTVVEDIGTVLQYISQGSNYRQMRGIRRLTLDNPATRQ